MAERRRLTSGMLVLTLFGALLLMPPLVWVFNQGLRPFGIPQIVIYLFVVWMGMILGTAALAHALPPDADAGPAEDD